MDPRPTKPDARRAAPDATKPARKSALEPTVVRAHVPHAPEGPLTDADKFLSPPQQADEVGRLGPYRVLGVLGRGGMGAVYRAHDPRLNRQVAVKVLLSDFADDEKAKARFRREAQAQAKVDHDHIVPIYEVEEANGVVYLAMPLLKGQSLHAALKLNRRPPVAELVRIGREIAEGLAAAHEVGLIHRDIKPANVWLEGNRRRVKILDFGLAREVGAPVEVGPKPVSHGGRTEDLTRAGALMGTPAYMSPEQARCAELDCRSDVFSLGIVLYEMATGRKPFGGATQFDLLAAIATQEPYRAGQTVPDLPPALDALIHRMLAKDPAARPQSCDEVAAELEAIARALVVPPVVVMPLNSVADASNEPNVWEDLDSTYQSDAPASADDPHTEAEPESADEAAPTEGAPRRVPRWALPAAGALAALLVALAVVLALPGRQVVTEAKAAAPKSNTNAPNTDTNKKKEEPPDVRAAVAWVLKNNGTVKVKPVGAATAVEVLALDKLPPSGFTDIEVKLPNRAANDANPAPLAGFDALKEFAFDGPEWSDARLARVLAVLKGKWVSTVKIENFAAPIPNAIKAVCDVKKNALHLKTDVPGIVRVADLQPAINSDVLKVSAAQRDADLDGLWEWGSWPKTFDLSGNPNLTAAGLFHIHAVRPDGRPDRVFGKLAFDFTGTGITEAEATAFAARFPNSVVKWDGAPLPLLRARRAAQTAIDRGAVLYVFGTPAPTQLKTGAELKGANDFRALAFGTGSFDVAIDPAKGWVQAAKGTVARPFTDDELTALLPDLVCQEVHLHGQDVTDAGAARALRAIRNDSLVALSLTNCAAGDESLRALAERAALRTLNLNATNVTPAGLAHLAGRVSLTTLRLADTELTDAAIPALSAFAGLHDLDLLKTKLTPEGIEKLRAALPYTIIRAPGEPNGTTHQPLRKPLGSALAAKKELFARGGTGGNGGSPVTDPEKWGTSIVNVSLQSGTFRDTDTAANGWEKKEEIEGRVKDRFDAAELISLFREAGFTTFNNWKFIGQNIDDTGAAALLALPGAQKLKGVQFHNCAVGDATAAHLARLPDATYLYLNDTKVGDAGVKALAEGNPRLRQLRLIGCKGVTNAAIPHLLKMQRLYELDLLGTNVTPEGAAQLAAALPYTYIRFPDDKPGKKLERARDRDPYKSEGAAKWFEARGGLLRNVAPAQLVLRTAKYTDPQSPANGWERNHTGGSAKVPFDDADLLALVGDLLTCDKPVTALSFFCLNGQHVTDAGFAALAGFPAVRAAHHIELIDMPLTDESAKALARFDVLTKVALNGTHIGDAGVKALAEHPHSHALLELRLARTRVTRAAVPDLLKLKWLRVLDLGGVALTAEDAAQLSAALPRCHIRYGDNKVIPPKVRVSRDEALKKLLARGTVVHPWGNKPLQPGDALPNSDRAISVTAESGTFRPNNHAGAGWESTTEKTGAVTEPLTDEDMELIAALELPGLGGLNLRNQKVTDAGLVPILRTPGARQLTGVTLAGCEVGDDTARALAELPDLRAVFFQHAPLTDAGARALLQARPGLQRLWLTGCEKLTDAIEPDLAKLFALAELDLRGTSVSDAAFERLCKALPHTRIRPAKGRTYTPPAELLREGANQMMGHLIARGATNARGELFEAEGVLTEGALLVRFTSAILLRGALAVPTSPTSSLRVASGRYFEPMGPGDKWEREADGPVKEPFIDADLVRTVSELWRAGRAPGPAQITYVALHKQNVTDAGVAALVWLPQLRGAHSIHVTECAIGDEAVKHIASLPNLKNAYLNRTKVTNAGVKHLVPRAATLDNLRLAHTLVTDAAIDDLLKLTNLTNLDVGGTAITAEGAQKLAAGLPNCYIRWGDDKEIAPAKK